MTNEQAQQICSFISNLAEMTAEIAGKTNNSSYCDKLMDIAREAVVLGSMEFKHGMKKNQSHEGDGMIHGLTIECPHCKNEHLFTVPRKIKFSFRCFKCHKILETEVRS